MTPLATKSSRAAPSPWGLWLVGAACALVFFVLASGQIWGPIRATFSSGPARLESISFEVNGRRLTLFPGQPLLLRPLDQVKVLGWKTRYHHGEEELEGRGFEPLALLSGLTAADLLPLSETPTPYQLKVMSGLNSLGHVDLVMVAWPVDFVLLSGLATGQERLELLKRVQAKFPTNLILLDQIYQTAKELGLKDEAARALEAKTEASLSLAELSELADLYRGLGQDQKEAAVLSRLAALKPQEGVWMDRLLSLAEQTGDERLKLSALDEVVRKAGGVRSAEAAKKLGYAYFQAGRLEEAAKAYDQAARLDPKDANIFQNLAAIYDKLGRPAERRQALSRLALLRPGDLDVVRELARSAPAQEAIAAWEKVLELKSEDEEAIVALIKLLQPEGPSAKLARLYRLMTLLRPNDPVIFYNLGLTLRALGETEQAEEALNRASELAPNDADILTALLEVQRLENKNEAALATAKKLAALKPERVELYHFIYQQLNQAGKLEELEKILSQSVKANPKAGELWKLLALARLNQNNPKAAAEALGQVVTLDPADAETRLRLAELLEKIGQEKEAVKHYQELVKRKPGDLELNLRLAELLERTGQTGEAIKAYQELVSQAPDNLDFSLNLARLLEKSGQLKKALACYEEILKRYPDNEAANDAYLRLRLKLLKKD